jgi:methylated-DNA-[protein]-cysteine S-methyltransferase
MGFHERDVTPGMSDAAFYSFLHSELGIIEIRANEVGILSISFTDVEEPSKAANDLTVRCRTQLSEYFSGTRRGFDLPLAPVGTAFEQGVWSELQRIEFGNTASYLDIAKRLNNPGAIRAVGKANGANPIAIVIPCHRIVGSDGSLTGYAGGLWRKRFLLDHEARIAGTRLF